MTEEVEFVECRVCGEEMTKPEAAYIVVMVEDQLVKSEKLFCTEHAKQVVQDGIEQVDQESQADREMVEIARKVDGLEETKDGLFLIEDDRHPDLDEYLDLRDGGLQTYAYADGEDGSRDLPEPVPSPINEFHSRLEARQTKTLDEHTESE